MRKLILLVMTVGIITACQSSENQATSNTEQTNFHKVIVQEVVQTTNYTYLHVKENDSLIWLALPLMQATVGETYYYENAMLMPNFQSKELNKTFDVVYFLAGVTKEPVSLTAKPQTAVPAEAPAPNAPATEDTKRSLAEPHEAPQAQVAQEKNIKIEPAKGGVTVAQLFSKKDSYSGKTVIIKGKVTKINPGIMQRNWIHIQDGTKSGENFDLTITSTTLEPKIGDVITFEGKITLNKDFGYGYFYDLLMEDAVQK